jgi:hypothetical protein
MRQNMMVYWVVCLHEDVYTSIPPISFKSNHIFSSSLRPGLCIKEMNVVSRMWTLVGSDKGTQNFQPCIDFRSLDDPTPNSFKFGVHYILVHQWWKILNKPKEMNAVSTKVLLRFFPPVCPFARFILTSSCLGMFWVHVMHVMNILGV